MQVMVSHHAAIRLRQRAGMSGAPAQRLVDRAFKRGPRSLRVDGKMSVWFHGFEFIFAVLPECTKLVTVKVCSPNANKIRDKIRAEART